jgi:hypothetical protein
VSNNVYFSAALFPLRLGLSHETIILLLLFRLSLGSKYISRRNSATRLVRGESLVQRPGNHSLGAVKHLRSLFFLLLPDL